MLQQPKQQQNCNRNKSENGLILHIKVSVKVLWRTAEYVEKKLCLQREGATQYMLASRDVTCNILVLKIVWPDASFEKLQ